VTEPTVVGAARSVDGPPFVVLGVAAGIAAYKAVEVCRRLVDAGVHVAPVLTERATRFVGRATFDALGSEPTQTSVWNEASPIPHTRLGQRADLVVVAPATADLLARYAAGLADDLLTTTLVATAAPVVVCPAMHTEMWEHPSVQDNLARLRTRGVTVVPPEEGRLAGGDVGSGRMAEPATIVEAVLTRLRSGGSGGTGDDLVGRRVLVTAGGTREAIDPVRFITNRSSGKQGHAVAAAALRRGADVVLVTTSSQPRPAGAEVVDVETAAQMQEAVLARAAGADVVVMAAAVADFRPKVVVDTKLHKSDGVPELILEPTGDILAELGRSWWGSPPRPTTWPDGPGPNWWPRASTSWWPTTSPPPTSASTTTPTPSPSSGPTGASPRYPCRPRARWPTPCSTGWSRSSGGHRTDPPCRT